MWYVYGQYKQSGNTPDKLADVNNLSVCDAVAATLDTVEQDIIITLTAYAIITADMVRQYARNMGLSEKYVWSALKKIYHATAKMRGLV